MTERDKVNREYHEKVLGKCVHEFEVSSERDHKGRIVWICKKCPRKISRFSHDPPVLLQFTIPDYASDRDVFYDCMVKSISHMEKVGDKWYAYNLKDDGDNGPYVDPNLILAAMKAVIKMEEGET